jgi:hypothetical protein
MRRWILFLMFSFPLAAVADDLSPDTAASVDHDRKKAYEKIDEAHGNKPLKDMSQEERRDYYRERTRAQKDVLEKHGLDDKAYSRYESRLSNQEREDKKAAGERLEKKEKDDADKRASTKKTEENKEPVIQRGFSDHNPVEVESRTNSDGAPVVEKGLPPGEGDESAGKGRSTKSDY